MAKAKYGNVIVEMAGSINGNTYQRGRYGAVVRVKPHAINRNTSAQSAVRTFFGILTKGWASLTQAQRDTWLMATLNFQKVNSLATTITLTGHQLYIAINRNLQSISEALITTAPPKVSVPALQTFSLIADVSGGTILMSFTAPILAADKLEIFATRPLSAGKKSNSQDYKLITVKTSAFVTGADIATEYEAIFGITWQTAGQKIFFLAKTINKATGEESTTAFANTIVVP